MPQNDPKQQAVNVTSAAYDSMLPKWQLVRALMGGTEAMREAGEMYLPRYEAESRGAWEIRKNRAVLTNIFRRTVRNLVGKPFSKPVTLNDDMPAKLVEWSNDIDLLGNDINVFGKNMFRDGMVAGFSSILVDFPRTEPNRTLADERASGARPYFVHIKAEQIIGARSTVVNGREVLTQVRICEEVTEPDGDFGEAEVTQIRVLFPGGFQIWRENDQGQWFVFDQGLTSLSYIPLVTWYTDRTGFMMSDVPLIDLAHLNVAHWQSSSDQRNVLTVTRFPILAVTGVHEESNLAVGPNTFMRLPAEADVKYVEHTGKAIEAGRLDLQDLKAEMELLGMEPLMPKSGDQTATARALDSAEAHSSLQMWAMGLKDALETAYGFAADFAKLERGGTIGINTDFGLSLRDAQDIEQLIKARMAGDLSRETLWAELKRRGVLSDEFDMLEEAERIEQEGPPLGMMGLTGQEGEEEEGEAA